MKGTASVIEWDDDTFERILERLATSGTIDARRVLISTERLERILDAAKGADHSSSRFIDANFAGAIFEGTAHFDKAIFEGTAHFDKTTFEGTARFDDATFERTAHLGPLRATELSLDRAVFRVHVTVELRAERLCAVGTQFQSGVDIRAVGTLVRPVTGVPAGSAKLTFERATFGDMSTVSTARRDTASKWLLIAAWGEPTIASVISLRWARIEDLALSMVDLRECHFRDAQGLEGLRLEQVIFDDVKGCGWHKKWFPFRYSHRVAIAEEHRWREQHQGPPPWLARERQGAADTARSDRPTPHQIVAVYRGLRKGVEDRKNEPGAGEWYYGEMEMRRHARYTGPGATGRARLKRKRSPRGTVTLVEAEGFDSTRRTPRGEKIVLFLYWLIAGYGLRASRAILALAITIALGAVLLDGFGVDANKDLDDGTLLFAAESSISLLRQPDTKKLTVEGHVIQIVLRLAGPLFFGLALLSLRGRVKR